MKIVWSKILISGFILLFFSARVNAQQSLFLYGKVINSATFEPVPFATILLKQTNLGVYANADGDFRIPLEADFQDDSVVITSIGFKRRSLAFRNLTAGRINRINLEPSVYEIGEVKVISERDKLLPVPHIVIARAIRNIEKNYPRKPFSYVAYYRDYQKRDSNYLNMNEALVLAEDGGFGTKSANNRYILLDIRKNNEFPEVDIPSLYNYNSGNKFIPGATISDIGGNELLILMIHDAIRNYKSLSFSFVNTFSSDFLRNHDFSEVTTVLDNNQALLKVSFTAVAKLTPDTISVAGEIFIHPSDYSIYKLDYSGYYTGKGGLNKEMFNIKIEYGRLSSGEPLMYPKYISFSNLFRTIDPADTSYFRLKDSYIEPSDPSGSTLVFEFSNSIDKSSAVKADHYKIMMGDKRVRIRNIIPADSAVMVIIENREENKVSSLASRQLKVELGKIRDVGGKVLNDRHLADFYQYRELFIQDYNRTPELKNPCYLSDKPLSKCCVTKLPDNNKYWMNSPLFLK